MQLIHSLNMTQLPKKMNRVKNTLTWLALSVWLSYSLAALWVLEKENIRIGVTCPVVQNKFN
jgi:hypothetical protein